MATRRTPLQIAELADKKGNHPKAIGAYLEHLSTNASDVRVLLRLAELQERMGAFKEASESFRKVGEQNVKQGFAAKAVSVLRRALKLHPDDVACALLLAQTLSQEGKNREVTEVLEAAANAALIRGDTDARIQLLQRAASLDGTARTAMSLADVMIDSGRRPAAIDVLRNLVAKLNNDERTLTDQVRVQERLAELMPADIDIAVQATQAALRLREPTRALLITRRALESKPYEARLIHQAAIGLEAYGEKTRAARVFREAARQYQKSGHAAGESECWSGVLRLLPNDPEALKAQVEPGGPDAGSWERLEDKEVENALEGLSPTAQTVEAAFDVEMESVPLEVLEVDLVPPTLNPIPVQAMMNTTNSVIIAFAEELHEAKEEARELANRMAATAPSTAAAISSQPPPAVTAPFAPAAGIPEVASKGASPKVIAPPFPEAIATSAPLVSPGAIEKTLPPPRVLVLGQDAEAEWAYSAMSDLGADILRLGADELGAAVERSLETQRDLILAPAQLREALSQAGGHWALAGPVTLPREQAWAAVLSAGLPVVAAVPVTSVTDLESALAQWGTPLELQGVSGAPAMVLSSATGAAYQLAVARQKLGLRLFVQRPIQNRAYAVLAGDGTQVVALGEFLPWVLDNSAGFMSGGATGEAARLALAEKVGKAVSLRGIAVIALAEDKNGWAFESFVDRLGPGALAVEVRLSISLIALSAEMARGMPLTRPAEARGVACAIECRPEPSYVLANLRVECGQDRIAYVCAHGGDLNQASRKLAKALGLGPKG